MKLANRCAACEKRIFVNKDVRYVPVGKGRIIHAKCALKWLAKEDAA